MEQLIYMIRHGQPDFPGGKPVCLGVKTDLPLSAEGRAQARTLADCLSGGEAVYSSELARARETAAILSGKAPTKFAAFNEMDMGEWDGMLFADIKERYADIYSKREADWSIPLPGGESLEDAADRALKRLERISENQAVVVTHDGLIRAILMRILHLDPAVCPMPRQAYASVTVLIRDERGFSVSAVGKRARDFPNDDEIRALWKENSTPPNVIAHSKAVCDTAMELLAQTNAQADGKMLRAAALLHDLRRTDGKEHPHTAAAVLRKRGYLKTAGIVESHHDLPWNVPVGERLLLYAADILTFEDRRVTLEERFAQSRKKCGTPEASAAHAQRKARAKSALKQIQSLFR